MNIKSSTRSKLFNLYILFSFCILSVSLTQNVSATTITPTLLGSISGLSGSLQNYDLKVSGNYAYVPIGYGLNIVDISNPVSPSAVGYIGYSDWIWDVAIQGNCAYLSGGGPGGPKIWTINISNKASPSAVGSISIPAGTSTGMQIVGDYLYVPAPSAFYIYSLTNPTSPSLVGSVNPGGNPRFGTTVAIKGNYAYMACTTAGLKVIDISNPASPNVEIGRAHV